MAGATEIVKSGFTKAISVFFEYDTPKIVHIRSKKVGVINRIIQLLILGYIIGYAIVWKKGYQDFGPVESATTTKLKGVVFTNVTNLTNPFLNHRIFDVADYVVPPQENDAFFVTTNIVYTANQTQGTCAEDPSMYDVICTSDDDCSAGEYVSNGNGMKTGKCVNFNSTLKTCEIHAWCPVEIDELAVPDKPLLDDAKKFTVLIKNNIEFPKFPDHKRRNILETQNKTYLTTCRYNSSDENDRLCPIFPIGTILKEAGTNFSEIAVVGGVMAISIHWECNLDFSIEDCIPEYSFSRLDSPNAKISKGYNFRYANYYDESGELRRDLIKAYGIRFVIKVTGQAGKFSPVPLLLNLGSGVGLLAIATVLCDIIVMYFLKKGDFYKSKKYKDVVDDDAFNGLLESDSDEDLIDDVEEPRGRRRTNRESGLLSNSDQPNYAATGTTDQLSQEQAVKNRRSRPGQGDGYSPLDD